MSNWRKNIILFKIYIAFSQLRWIISIFLSIIIINYSYISLLLRLMLRTWDNLELAFFWFNYIFLYMIIIKCLNISCDWINNFWNLYILMHNYYQRKNQQFLKFNQPAWFYIKLFTFLCMMIVKYLYTSYDLTQRVLKIIQPISDFLLKYCWWVT